MISTCLLQSSHIIKVTNQTFRYHHFRHCIVVCIDHLLDGLIGVQLKPWVYIYLEMLWRAYA